jgi:hypothetical protein
VELGGLEPPTKRLLSRDGRSTVQPFANIDHRLTKKTLAAISVGETVGPLSWGSAKYWSEGRICCFFVLSLIFLDFFSLRFSFVYLRCVPNATQRDDVRG